MVNKASVLLEFPLRNWLLSLIIGNSPILDPLQSCLQIGQHLWSGYNVTVRSQVVIQLRRLKIKIGARSPNAMIVAMEICVSKPLACPSLTRPRPMHSRTLLDANVLFLEPDLVFLQEPSLSRDQIQRNSLLVIPCVRRHATCCRI